MNADRHSNLSNNQQRGITSNIKSCWNSTYPLNRISLYQLIVVSIAFLVIVLVSTEGEWIEPKPKVKKFNQEEFYNITMRKIRQEEWKIIQVNKKWKEEPIFKLTKENAAKADYSDPEDSSDRPLVLYAYAESNFARANLQFFVQHGLHSKADFLFIVNGNATLDTLIPDGIPNIRILRRGNDCFDLGGIGEVLNANDSALVKKYKRFILMNASVRGPFMPIWSYDCWTDMFLNKLNDEVKLVGTTYNCGGTKHVQSMVFATDRIGLNVLLHGNITYDKDPNFLGGLSSCVQDKMDAIGIEISLTNLIYRAKYKVAVLMTESSSSPDWYQNCKEGGWANVHAYETIFVKTNSNYNIEFDTTNRLTEYHNYLVGRTSWDLCALPKDYKK